MAKKKVAKKKTARKKRRRKQFRFLKDHEKFLLEEYLKVRGKKGKMKELTRKFNRKFGTRLNVRNVSAKCSRLWLEHQRRPKPKGIVAPEEEPVILIIDNVVRWRGSSSKSVEVIVGGKVLRI